MKSAGASCYFHCIALRMLCSNCEGWVHRGSLHIVSLLHKERLEAEASQPQAAGPPAAAVSANWQIFHRAQCQALHHTHLNDVTSTHPHVLHLLHRQRLEVEASTPPAAAPPAAAAAADSVNWQILHRTGPHVWTDSVLAWMGNANVGFHEALAPGEGGWGEEQLKHLHSESAQPGCRGKGDYVVLCNPQLPPACVRHKCDMCCTARR
jgi:hypothetical protein